MIKEKIEREKIRCKFCVNFEEGRCNLKECEYLLDIALEGEMALKDMIIPMFKECDDKKFRMRLKKVWKSFTGEWFLSSFHKDRFYHYFENVRKSKRKDKKYFAALYLLTSQEKIWQRAINGVTRKENDFNKINIKGVNVNSYAIYWYAKNIYQGIESLDWNEISDESIIGGFTFKMIINRLIIEEYSGQIIKALAFDNLSIFIINIFNS